MIASTAKLTKVEMFMIFQKIDSVYHNNPCNVSNMVTYFYRLLNHLCILQSVINLTFW